jgi:hypothetical protein
MRHIIIGADSRGAKLDQYLQRKEPFDFHHQSHILVRPGGKFSHV